VVARWCRWYVRLRAMRRAVHRDRGPVGSGAGREQARQRRGDAMSVLIGRRVRVEALASWRVEEWSGTVQAVAYNPGACGFVLLVLDDEGALHEINDLVRVKVLPARCSL